MIYFLFLCFLALLYFVYLKFDKDIIAPPFVLVGGYALSILCAIANIDRWGIELHYNTVGVLLYGTLLFIVPSYFIKKFLENKRKINNDNNEVTNIFTGIELNFSYLKIYCFFQLLLLFIWLGMIYYIVSGIQSINSYSEMMTVFRIWSTNQTEWVNNYLFVFLNQFAQITNCSAYLFMYIFIFNTFSHEYRYNKILIISIILSIVQILLGGGRMGMLAIMFAGIMLYMVFYYQKFNKHFEINKKVICILLMSIVCGAILFTLSLAIARGGVISINGFLPYITFYIGGAIQGLDMFLQNPPFPSDIWGKETFWGLNFQLARFGILDLEPYRVHLEFRTAVTGARIGNIYTAYRSYIYDFGYWGLTILPVLFSSIISYWYYNASLKLKKINLSLLFYSLIFYTLFFDFVRCFFFSFFSLSLFKQFFILLLLSLIFIKEFKIPNLNNLGGNI